MNLPTKPGFDLEAWMNGVPAVTDTGDIEIFESYRPDEAYPYNARSRNGYYSDGKGIGCKFIGMLDVSALSAKTESPETKLKGLLTFSYDEEPHYITSFSDDELLVRFACASLTGLLAKNEPTERIDFEYKSFDFAECMLAEFKKRREK